MASGARRRCRSKFSGVHRDLSQRQLAFDCGLHRTYISGMERGVRNPTVVVLETIAKALKVATASLLDSECIRFHQLRAWSRPEAGRRWATCGRLGANPVSSAKQN
jgi:transcriptional regulator with XRE-family HTH domain